MNDIVFSVLARRARPLRLQDNQRKNRHRVRQSGPCVLQDVHKTSVWCWSNERKMCRMQRERQRKNWKWLVIHQQHIFCCREMIEIQVFASSYFAMLSTVSVTVTDVPVTIGTWCDFKRDWCTYGGRIVMWLWAWLMYLWPSERDVNLSMTDVLVIVITWCDCESDWCTCDRNRDYVTPWSMTPWSVIFFFQFHNVF